ncbi:LpqN/LpqT family lipoprotein [[Mycobacterium] holstebronense]|uniref:LpqN/LpqT family lipoprotein n=1 Tax=[Mycobacterium] holstebronense TaxID=3064288 RepID=A0ABM9LHY3_9MYCO|nr:LpqN/LpqT family lipoprotein [Mycolicibacter sp. MU0102]CAJ1499291.1 LpqN/LpqT family lipoprotein [Mycolicibacter sp. MU0102]
MENSGHAPAEGSIILDPRDIDEPTITLPRPPGWEFLPSNESPPVRGVLYNQELRRHGFTPNAVVTCEELTGQVGLPAQALAKERAAVIDLVGDLDTDIAGTVSGFPSRTISYNLQGRPATGLLIAVQNTKARIWAITVTLQTTDADNPHYIAAKQALLDSVEVRLPTP